MKVISLITVLAIGASVLYQEQVQCSLARQSDRGPERLLIIQGKATIVNLPGSAEEVPATSETLIFQKIGCESCFVGAKVDIEGNYKILVGDRRYKLIVNSPSAPDVDLLAPEQERFIDTQGVKSTNSILTFNVKINVPLKARNDTVPIPPKKN